MSVGAQLRHTRETRGLTVEALARATRVQPRIVEAIERDDITSMPPRPFGRGFVGACARELGLDPDPITRAYFAQFAPALPPADALAAPPPDRRRLPLALAGAVTLVAIVGVAVALRSSPASPGDDDTSPRALGTTGTVPPPAAPPAAASPAPSRVSSAPAEVVSAPTNPAGTAISTAPALTIVVRATTRRAWVAARADGERTVYQLLMPGEERTITAAESVSLRVGDAGALTWRINGRDAGAMGRSGQVRDIRVTPATAASQR